MAKFGNQIWPCINIFKGVIEMYSGCCTFVLYDLYNMNVWIVRQVAKMSKLAKVFGFSSFHLSKVISERWMYKKLSKSTNVENGRWRNSKKRSGVFQVLIDKRVYGVVNEDEHLFSVRDVLPLYVISIAFYCVVDVAIKWFYKYSLLNKGPFQGQQLLLWTSQV